MDFKKWQEEQLAEFESLKESEMQKLRFDGINFETFVQPHSYAERRDECLNNTGSLCKTSQTSKSEKR